MVHPNVPITSFPVLGLLWGFLLLFFARLDPVVGMILSVGSAIVAAIVFMLAVLLLSPQRGSALVLEWNFLTTNAAVVVIMAAFIGVALGCAFSTGILEFEILPVPT